MKKVGLILAILCVLVVHIGADIRGRDTTTSAAATAPKKFCKGYTIIEFGKAVDCNGDTLRLVKVDGGQEILKEPS
jgi:hypothetical protein